MKPLIGISCCVKAFGVFNTPNHAASDSHVRAVLGPAPAQETRPALSPPPAGAPD